MKNIIICLLALLSLGAKAQDKASLEKNAGLMMEYTAKENYKSLMDLTYPKLFELFPKEQMLEMLPAMLKGDGYTISLLDTPPNFVYGDIKKIDGGSYVLIKHDLKMKMAFTEPMNDEELDAMLPMFKQSMGTEDITFNKPENAFYIKKRAQMIGAADKLTGNKWTFLNNDNPELLKKLLNENIIKGLGL